MGRGGDFHLAAEFGLQRGRHLTSRVGIEIRSRLAIVRGLPRGEVPQPAIAGQKPDVLVRPGQRAPFQMIAMHRGFDHEPGRLTGPGEAA